MKKRKKKSKEMQLIVSLPSIHVQLKLLSTSQQLLLKDQSTWYIHQWIFDLRVTT